MSRLLFEYRVTVGSCHRIFVVSKSSFGDTIHEVHARERLWGKLSKDMAKVL